MGLVDLALVVTTGGDPDNPQAPGLLILDQAWDVESATPGVERWLDELPDGDSQRAGRLPAAILAVAGQALRTSEQPASPGDVALSRVLTRSGHWIVLHGASLVTDGRRRVAVILEPAHPARIAPLLWPPIRSANASSRSRGWYSRATRPPRWHSVSSCPRTPYRSTSRASARRRAYPAGATSWARCSSHTMSPGFGQ